MTTVDKGHWDQRAQLYDAVMNTDPALRDLREAVVANVPASARSVIDLGCGTGALLMMLAEHSRVVALTGLDPAPEMLRTAGGLLGSRVDLLHASAKSIPARDESFDCVISCFALHHLAHDEKPLAAGEMFRVMVPGGRFALGDQFFNWTGGPDDRNWVRAMFDHLCGKARYYLDNASIDRMILQIELMPLFLRARGELPVPPQFWTDALIEAGFSDVMYRQVEPEFLQHGVLTGRKP